MCYLSNFDEIWRRNINPKKDDKTDKDNYRPISIFPNLSKVYERLLRKQIYLYFETLLPKFQCGLRKGFNPQHCLLAMIEKAFDCIDHNLLIAKLSAYRFEKESIDFFHSYLTNCKQKTKGDSSYSSWEMLLSGAFQVSILGALL